MIYIYHGDNQLQSREELNRHTDNLKDHEILRLDHKSITLERVNNFINIQTLFASPKTLVLSNFFSTPKAILDKIIPILNSNSDTSILIWQDKKLTLAQTNNFPKAKVRIFNPDKTIFSCINAIRPDNLPGFVKSYHQTLETQAYDLIFYLIKTNFRKQLSTYSKFNPQALKKTYLNLIELEFQTKTGTLTTPKEIALERVIIPLLR